MRSKPADFEGLAVAAAAVEELTSVLGSHASAEAEFAGSFDETSSFGIVRWHRKGLSLMPGVIRRVRGVSRGLPAIRSR